MIQSYAHIEWENYTSMSSEILAYFNSDSFPALK